jgi:hypothetical protein
MATIKSIIFSPHLCGEVSNRIAKTHKGYLLNGPELLYCSASSLIASFSGTVPSVFSPHDFL